MPERTNQVDHLDRGRDGWVHCPAAEKEDSSISEVSSVSQVSSAPSIFSRGAVQITLYGSIGIWSK